jgi:subtilisin family serine protease
MNAPTALVITESVRGRMRRSIETRFVSVSLAAALLFSGVTAPTTSAAEGAIAAQQPVKTLEEAVKTGRVQPASVDDARLKGGAHILVELQLPAPFRPEGEIPPTADQQRRNIAAAQEAVVRQLAGKSAVGLKRFQTVPGLAVFVDTTALTALVGMAEVARITVDGQYALALDTSTRTMGGENVRRAVGAPAAGAGLAVAILDTGVEASHPFFGGRVVSEACYSSNVGTMDSFCANGVEESTAAGSGGPCGIADCDHGTHVAGIAAGNGAGLVNTPDAGVAPAASIISIQVFSKENSTTVCQLARETAPCLRASYSDVIRGMERVYALRNAFEIAAVNLSLGSGNWLNQPSCDLANLLPKAAIDNLRSASIATVAASGNGGNMVNAQRQNVFQPGVAQPACISTAVSVGRTAGTGNGEAVTIDSQTATFLDLLAPGTNIMSSVINGGFAPLGGTSMATPHVTGSFAVLRSLGGRQSVGTLLTALTTTGVPIVDNRPAQPVTTPRIQLDGAVEVRLGTLLKPSNLRVLGAITGTLITLDWQDNSASETSFTIEYKRPSDTSWRFGRTTAANAHGAMLGSWNNTAANALTPNTTYQMRVKACANAVCSDPSNVVEQSTLDTLPSVPTNVRAGTVGDRSIELLWDSASTNPITRFEIVSNTPNTPTTLNSSSPSFTNRRHTFSGLNPDDPYTFEIRACNDEGCSAYTSARTFRTLPPVGLPPAPTNLRGCVQQPSLGIFCLAGITVSWNDNATDEDRYELEWTQAAPNTVPFGPGSNVTTVQLAPNARSYWLQTVTSGALYYFRVRAHNTSGYSPYSSILTQTP